MKESVTISKPLPSEEDEKKEKEKPGSRVKTLIQSQEKEPVAEGTDWGEIPPLEPMKTNASS